jgi:hypothetical protein
VKLANGQRVGMERLVPGAFHSSNLSDYFTYLVAFCEDDILTFFIADNFNLIN